MVSRKKALEGVKMVDLISASFAAGEMPGAEGLVDKEYAREKGYLIGEQKDQLLRELNGTPEPEATVHCPVVIVTRVEDTGFAEVLDVYWSDGTPAETKTGLSGESVTTLVEAPVPVATVHKYQPGDYALFVPAGSKLPDEPEFSSWGASRRKTPVDKLLPLDTVARLMARRVPMEVLPGEDAEEHAQAVLEALTQTLQLGDDLAEVLGITAG